MADSEARQPIVLQPPENGRSWERNQIGSFDVDGASARIRFREFFRNFKVGNVFIYREALIRSWTRNEFFVEVDLAHLAEYDEILFNNIQVRSRTF